MSSRLEVRGVTRIGVSRAIMPYAITIFRHTEWNSSVSSLVHCQPILNETLSVRPSPESPNMIMGWY